MPHPSPAEPIAQDMGHVLRGFDKIGAMRFPMVRDGSVLPAELQRPMSWVWRGPVDQAVKILAERIGYRTVIADKPDAPTVTFSVDHGTAATILDEMASGLENRASIMIDVPQHLIRVDWHA
ncbi:hypothetical protein AA105894_2504 [Asaia spathodeae NBRC 105894]|nr:hypothetical protein AA105894_2504 [Asaia spathodeae NBRC 105894]